MTGPASHRRPELDIARAIGILCVLYGHALEMTFLGRAQEPGFAFAQWRFLYSFHMPLFFLVSGMLFRERRTRDAIANALLLLLIAAAVHALGWLGTWGLGDPGATLDSLLFPLLNGYGFYTSVVWFLVALSFVQLAHHAMARSGPAGRAAVAALLAASFVVAQMTGTYRFQMGALLPGAVFYAIGHWLARSGHAGPPAGLRSFLIPAAIAATLLLAPLNNGCLLDPVARCGIPALNGGVAVWMAFGTIGFAPAFLVTALLGSLGVLWSAQTLAQRGGGVATALSALGARTLDLLIVNGFVLQFVQPHLKRLIADGAPAWVGVAWALGLTMAQVLLLPLLGRATGPLIALARGIAETTVGGRSTPSASRS
ncbi:acyltransferase [Azospirillum agricola]|uniref:acyltransferase family protein n=1 Tax=Azospirillum agricola TaxID=1720247 RepID=UPI001AE595C6|nr:acyltransferase family protein [Azospirillum agricola]MBP2232991.1 acyltransferase [Azospirillum agricola]